MLEIFLEEQVDHHQGLELMVDQELEVLEVAVELHKLILVLLKVLTVVSGEIQYRFLRVQ
jgi:hypothetical protein